MGRKSYLFNTDIVESIIAESRLNEFPTDRQFLHRYLYDCKDKYSILGRFIFDDRGGACCVTSGMVENAMDNMLISSLLAFRNLDDYIVMPKLRTHYKTYLKNRLSENQKKEIKAIASGLEERLNEFLKKESKCAV